MIVDQLLPDCLFHPGEGVVGAGQVSLHLAERILHHLLQIDPLVLGDPGGQTEPFDVPADSDPGGFDRDVVVDVSDDLAGVHVAGVDRVGADAVVLLDQRVEHLREVIVRVVVACVDAAVLIVELKAKS